MDFIGGIKLRTLRWEIYPDCLGGPARGDLIKGTLEKFVRERGDVRTKAGVREERGPTAGSEDGRRGREPRQAGSLEAEKVKKQILPLKPPAGNSLANTLNLASETFLTSDLLKSKKINLCYSVHWVGGIHSSNRKLIYQASKIKEKRSGEPLLTFLLGGSVFGSYNSCHVPLSPSQPQTGLSPNRYSTVATHLIAENEGWKFSSLAQITWKIPWWKISWHLRKSTILER